MKSMIVLALLSLSTSVFAVSENSSWSAIKASKSVSAKAPTIAFDAGAATTFVSVLDLCTDGENVQTLNKMEVYKHVMRNNRNALEVVGTKILSKPLTYTTTVWRKVGASSTSEQVEITETIAVDYDIAVVAKILGTSREGAKLFTKEFSIPACL